MSRTAAALPGGSRIADYISLGVARYFPREKVDAVLKETGRVVGQVANLRPIANRPPSLFFMDSDDKKPIVPHPP
jgi:hypothetical protein